jgi:hypothetical protein
MKAWACWSSGGLGCLGQELESWRGISKTEVIVGKHNITGAGLGD